MPRHEYICPAGHRTDRVTPIRKTPPKSITCPIIHCFPDGHPKRDDPCGKRAKKAEVYRVSVQGDLPTRGAF